MYLVRTMSILYIVEPTFSYFMLILFTDLLDSVREDFTFDVFLHFVSCIVRFVWILVFTYKHIGNRK